MNHVEKPRRLSVLLSWLPPVLTGPAIGSFLARVILEVWPAQWAVLATWQGTAQVAAAATLILLGLRWVWLRVSGRFTQDTTRTTHSHTQMPTVALHSLLDPSGLYLLAARQFADGGHFADRGHLSQPGSDVAHARAG